MEKVVKLFNTKKTPKNDKHNISPGTNDRNGPTSMNDDDLFSDKRYETFRKCSTCKRYNTRPSWCQSCDPQLLTQGWSSGNEAIDELIKSTQLRATSQYNKDYLQWIPYDDLKDIEEIGEGGFATIYKATWINGKKYANYEDDMVVALKRLHNSQNISDGFLSEFKNYVKFHRIEHIIHVYGVSQDPSTKEYIFVMQYIKEGNLYDYLSKGFKNLKWKNKIQILLGIIVGLSEIHEQKVVHHDLHSGNILQNNYQFSYIADLGFSIPAAQKSTKKNSKYGVLPYVAPEVLNGKSYTMASDIYSFGVLMSVVSTGLQPFSDVSHDKNLAAKICKGARPGFSINTSKIYIELAYKCMDAKHSKRPTAKEIEKIIDFWYNSLYCIDDSSDARSIRKEFESMDKIEFDPSTITATVHPNAVYTSKLLNFTNLPRLTNSSKVTIIGNNNESKQVNLADIG